MMELRPQAANAQKKQTVGHCIRLASLVVTTLFASVATGNVVGTDTQNFNPVVSHPDFVTVHGTKTLQPLQFHLGLFANQATNSLPYTDEDVQSRVDPNDSLVGLDLGIGVGIMKNVDLAVVLPFVAHQSIDDETSHGEFAENGNTEIRANIKWRAIAKKSFGLAAIFSGNINRIRENPHTGAAVGPTYNLELAADTRVGKWAFAGNIGYRFRDQGEPVEGALVKPLGDQYLGSIGTRYKLTSKSALIAELYGAQASDLNSESHRAETISEVIGGYRYSLYKNTKLHAGVGTEVTEGLATPDWRIYLGLNQLMKPKFAKSRKIAKKRKKRRKVEEEVYAEEPVEEDNIYFAAANDDDVDLGNPIDQVPTEEPDEVITLKDVKFEFDSDNRILRGGIDELKKIAEYARDTGFKTLVVEGHTDYKGSDDYNQDLSLRRARTVRRHFIKYLGFGEKDILAVGYGEAQPKTMDQSDRGRQINRRVEVKFYRD